MDKYLVDAEKKEIEKTFRIFDQDGSGSICNREFDQILKSMGHHMREEEIETMLKEIDKNGDGFVSLDEFIELVAAKIISNRNEKHFVNAFRIIDRKGDGVIDRE